MACSLFLSGVRLLCLALLSLIHNNASAFVTPQAFVGSRSSSTGTTSTLHTPPLPLLVHSSSGMNMLPSSFLLGDNGAALVDAVTSVEASEESALGVLRNFFIGITAVVVGLGLLTYATAAFIVPKAAQRLEADTNRLRPGLWDEYIAKLEEGETMSMRPDLLQELGNIMQPVILADFDESAAKKDQQKQTSSGASSSPASSPPSVMDATIVTNEPDSSSPPSTTPTTTTTDWQD
mmetsp:Transcript_27041/g.49205  ORF Transcript_27041/g.49205 Transcript_27041/m.49205 type:complete len:235 (-) Transcript_27041:192-896(-)